MSQLERDNISNLNITTYISQFTCKYMIFGDFKLADFSCGLFLENNHSLVFRSVFMISEKEEVVY